MRELVCAEKRDPLDFYRTPRSAVEAILPHLRLDGLILEPSAGDGAILAALRDRGVPYHNLEAVEIDYKRSMICGQYCATYCGDFRHWRAPRRYDLVIGNPPYKHAQRFVERSLAIGETVAMLLRLGFLESLKRARFHRAHPADVFVFSRRPSFLGGGKTYPAPFAWFVWGPGRGRRWSLL